MVILIRTRSFIGSSRYCQMIAQINPFIVFCPVVDEKLYITKNPFSNLFKDRGFFSVRAAHSPEVSCCVSTRSYASLSCNRVTRVARTEAQDALFDYLHSTRSYSFTDAEHVSKNSPQFLQNLLSKIDSDKNVARSLRKFLQYNPINEFEPFFESLGLSPSEASSLLPRHLMFLSDDHVLLENFHALSNYGIPRGKMGKMYKEAREIFRGENVSLAMKLQFYENLGLGKSTVIKLVSCCPTLLVGGIDHEFVTILEKLNRLGLKNDWIGGYLSEHDSFNWRRMLDMMDFLEKVGYNKEQLHYLFKTRPTLVLEGSGKKVYVLFGRLFKLGLKMNDISSLFIQNPQALSVKCAKNLDRAVDFFLDIGMGVEETGSIIATHIELLCSCSLKRPNTVCKELDFSKDGLCQIIREDPKKFFSSAFKLRAKSTKEVVSKTPSNRTEKIAFLLKLGYVENSDEMMRALKKFRGRGDQLQERFDCLVQAGLDYHVVSSLVRQAPMVLNLTKDVIEKKINCLTNCLGYPVHTLAAFPTYLCYDMERINQRFTMYAWLRDRGAAKPMLSLGTILACSDARFVKYFVDAHPEAPTIWERIRKVSA
uniref:Uncharacterized protein n=1 Tax=Rhizophora mucronata TaxID=61149 RepID=A0A2P2ISC5_RHIMU